jgi:hypothetical protein
MVVGKKYYTATSHSPTRETQSHKNIITLASIMAARVGPDGYVPVAQRGNGKSVTDLTGKVNVAKDVIMPALGMAQETGTLDPVAQVCR